MNKIKLLTFFVVILVSLNIGLGCFFVLSNKGFEKRMPKEIIIEKLHFDKQQIALYEVKIDDHRHEIRTLNDAINSTKNELYQLLNTNTIKEVKKDSLIHLISEQQNQIENVHFNHYLDIKSICKKEQIADFNTLTTELSQIFFKKQRRRNE